MNRKTLVIGAFLLALLAGGVGGIAYGGYVYWLSQQSTPELQQPPAEREVEIIKNPDGTRAFYNYAYNYKFEVPEGWVDPEMPFGDPNYIHLAHLMPNDGRYLNIHIRADPDGEITCSCKGEEAKMTLAGQEAKVCNYIPQRPTQDGWHRISFGKGNTSYLIIVAPFKSTKPLGVRTILNSFTVF